MVRRDIMNKRMNCGNFDHEGCRFIPFGQAAYLGTGTDGETDATQKCSSAIRWLLIFLSQAALPYPKAFQYYHVTSDKGTGDSHCASAGLRVGKKTEKQRGSSMCQGTRVVGRSRICTLEKAAASPRQFVVRAK